MKMNAKLLAFFAVAAALVSTSCNKDDDNNTPGFVLQSDIQAVIADGETVTLEQNTTYRLDGGVHVQDGGKLVIKEGVTIISQYDDVTCDYIFIEQGGTINAVGNSSEPIVMTCTNKTPGAWGGLHICGKAPINSGTPSLSEIESKPYGGTDSADNSGTLKYVRLEYTGYSYNEDQECNGISFYGVGSGTTVEYCQAYMGSDDGFEFFGGTVNIKHCVVTDCSDDSFDWTDGWVGNAQFLVAYQSGSSNVCDCLLECDNNGSDNEADPSSNPTIANATLVGNTYSDTKKDGVMLKAGTSIQLYNTLVTGKTYDVNYKTAVTIANVEGTSGGTEDAKFDGVFVATGAYKNSTDDKTSTITGITKSTSFSSTSSFYNGMYTTTDAASSTDISDLDDTFFADTDYVGAFDGTNDWTANWTK